MPLIDVSVVIVSYNIKELLNQCLASLQKFMPRAEIIVVDNASSDGSLEMLRQNWSSIFLIENKGNVGFPAANNQAFQVATKKYVLMLNPDTQLVDDSFNLAPQYLETHPDIWIIAPQLLNADGSVQRSVARFPSVKYIAAEMFYLDRLLKSKFYREKDFNKEFVVDSAYGAALFFERQLPDKIGMLDERLFWIEDIDFCYRTWKAGGKVQYLPVIKLIHFSGGSAKKNYNVSIRNQIINKVKFYKVHRGVFQLAIVFFISLLNVLVRLVVFSLLAPFKRVFFLKMKAYWNAIPHVFASLFI
jgi:GT2 family glycosyltransferase